MTDNIRNDEQTARWILEIDGITASALMYNDNGTTVSMTSTFTNPKYRGQGLAGKVTEAAVNDAETRGRKVRAMCPYVADWFKRHPEKAGLLAD